MPLSGVFQACECAGARMAALRDLDNTSSRCNRRKSFHGQPAAVETNSQRQSVQWVGRHCLLAIYRSCAASIYLVATMNVKTNLLNLTHTTWPRGSAALPSGICADYYREMVCGETLNHPNPWPERFNLERERGRRARSFRPLAENIPTRERTPFGETFALSGPAPKAFGAGATVTVALSNSCCIVPANNRLKVCRQDSCPDWYCSGWFLPPPNVPPWCGATIGFCSYPLDFGPS
jgi:hypothetical protein